jgi:hypothetical protein
MQVVYVLTTDSASSVYVRMTFVSLLSLKYSNSDFKTILICDDITQKTLNNKQHQILSLFDEVINVGNIDGNRNYINRFIKTSIYKYINNDFLYLDADTFIMKKIPDLKNVKFLIAGIRNHNHTKPQAISVPEFKKMRDLQWNIPKEYINGGVLFIKKDKNVSSFFDIYHNKWLQSYTKTGDHRDQHCLNSAIEDSDISLRILPDIYNTQGWNSSTKTLKPKNTKNVVIYHTYGYLWNSSVFKNIKDQKDIKNIINNSNNIWIK